MATKQFTDPRKSHIEKLRQICDGDKLNGLEKVKLAIAEMWKIGNDELRADAEKCEKSLLEFVKGAWHVVEPSHPFVPGWHIEVICAHLQAVTKFDITKLIINCPPRHSKPVWDESLILMGDGSLIPLKNVRVGEFVITAKNRAKRVSAVHQQGDLDCLKITTFSGREVVAAPDHLFLTPEGWVAAGCLKINQCLAIPNSPTFLDVPNKAGGLFERSYQDEEFSLAGYFIGDGCTSPSKGVAFAANITSADVEYIDEVKQCANQLGFVAKARSPSKPMGKFNATLRRIDLSGGVRPWLEDIGLARKTSYTKRVPEFVFRGSQSQIAKFIAAYFHCDGTIGKKAPNRKNFVVSFSSVSKGLLQDVQHLLMRLGINARLRARVAKNPCFGVVNYKYYCLDITQEHEAAKFMTRIPLVGRKKDRLTGYEPLQSKFDAGHYADPIVSIEVAGKLPCRCLTVEDDSSFVANDIVVHNSTLISVMWFCWSWANDPSTRWIYSSYSSSLSELDHGKCRRLINSPWYQARWGNKFQIVKGQDTQTRTGNTQEGWRLATGITTVGGGVGAEYLCLPYGQRISTNWGWIPIGEIVEGGAKDLLVTTFNHDDLVKKQQPIEDRFFSSGAGKDIYRIITPGFFLELTNNHPVYVRGRGYVPASCVVRDDELYGQNCIQTVLAIEKIPPVEKVYNLKIAGENNYFAEGILVHNCGDDLHKIGEAHSVAMRNTVLRNWDNVLSTRWNNPDRFARLLIHHRVHEQDITGHVLASDRGYEQLVLPAEYEPARYFFPPVREPGMPPAKRPRDAIVPTSLQMARPELRDGPEGSGRKELGDLLWPARINVAKLEEMKGEFTAKGAGAAGLLQQRPSPADGDVFERGSFRYFHVEYQGGIGKIILGKQIDGGPAPMEVPLDRATFFQCVDTALKQNQNAKYTAVLTFAVVGVGNNGTLRRFLLVWDAWRARVTVPEQYDILKALRKGRGVFNAKTRAWDVPCERVPWPKPIAFQAVEEVSGSIGLFQQAAADGYPLESLSPHGGDKQSRAFQISTLYKLGCVYHREGMPGLVELEDEALSFPSGAYSDQIDTLSYAGILYNKNKYLLRATEGMFVYPNAEEARRLELGESHYEIGGQVVIFDD